MGYLRKPLGSTTIDQTAMVEMGLNFESISLELCGDGSLWLRKPDGEGMEVWKNNIEKLLNDYYTENF